MLEFISQMDIIEKIAKVAAILTGGAWVYFNTIRGRTFIPRLKPQVSGKLLFSNGNQYLHVNLQVDNVGSSIAKIKETGTALKVTSLHAGGDSSEAIYLKVVEVTAFPVFDLAEGEIRIIEPGTTIYSQELFEVPKNKYNAFRIELHVSTLPGNWLSKKNRKWRASATVLIEDTAKITR